VVFFHNKIIRKGAVLLAAAIVLAGCRGNYYEDPVRPAKVPKNASWTRTSDGIVWILCKGGKGGDQCTVYSASTGSILIKGTFLLVGTSKGLAADKLSYDYFDGKRILLNDGRMLQCAQEPSKSKSAAKGQSRRKKQA
jgi:hypothetical protein